MSYDSLFVLLVLVLFAAAIITEKSPIDLAALTVLLVFTLAGYLSPAHAFLGFSSPAVVTLFGMFFMSSAFLHTGLADLLSKQILRIAGTSERKNLCIIMGLAGILSAFMANVAVTLILMPTVASVAKRARIAPGKLFIPLSFAALLGGTITSVGTAPNIILADFINTNSLGHTHLLDFTLIGSALLVAGTIYIVMFGVKSLPQARKDDRGSENIAKLYKMEERLFSIIVPENSALNGRTLGELKFGSDLRVGVVAIVRKEHTRLAPNANDIVKAGDRLVVRGHIEDLEFQLKIQALDITKEVLTALDSPESSLCSAQLEIKSGASLIGKSLRENRFRKESGLIVLAINREEHDLNGELSVIPLLAGDKLLVIGSEESISAQPTNGNFSITRLADTASWNLDQELFSIKIESGSVLEGLSIRASRLGEILGLLTLGISRAGKLLLVCSPDEIIQANDKLFILGDSSRLIRLKNFSTLSLDMEVPASLLQTDDVTLFEVSLTPRSAAVGKTVHELHFRERFGMQVLAIWRAGNSIRIGLRYEPLRFGDALLLLGPPAKIPQLAADPDYIVLSDLIYTERRSTKAPLAAGCFLLFILLISACGMLVQVAAALSAILLVVLGTIKMEDVYRSVEWRILIFVGALVPLGEVMVNSGAAADLASAVNYVTAPMGTYGALMVFILISSLVSQILDSTLSVIVLAPVALAAANTLGVNPMPLLMGTAFAASLAFLFPFSHRSHLLVMGAGGYSFRHYFKVGLPVTLICFILLIFLVPVSFPF